MLSHVQAAHHKSLSHCLGSIVHVQVGVCIFAAYALNSEPYGAPAHVDVTII